MCVDIMPLSITSVVRMNGVQCNHVTITVNHEGTTRTFETSFPELDELITKLGGPVEAQKSLVMLWAAYRRFHSRTTTGVNIA